MMRTLGWKRSWTLARRDLSGDFRGLRLLFVCLFLGVATLTAIGSLTAAITGEIAARGQTILGGDIQIEMEQRKAGEEELRTFRQIGTLSESIRLNAMARPVDGQRDAKPILTELKAVDTAYPLYGALDLRDGDYDGAIGDDEILIDPALANRLSLEPGDRLQYGEAEFIVADIIADEPDRVGEGFTFGPVAITSLAGLDRTGLIRPGSLFEAKYRIRIAPGQDVKAVREELEDRTPEVGWDVDDRDNAAPGTNRFIERMGQFLSLIGLTALVVAGIGVGNGVSSYLGMKRDNLATLKILGATSRDIMRIYVLQVGMVALAGMTAGLVAGALMPPLLLALAGDILPVEPGFGIQPIALLTSAAYGLLVAFIFLLPPLVRAGRESAAAIFREDVSHEDMRIDRRSLLLIGIAVLLLAAMVLLTARDPLFSGGVLAAILGVLVLLLGMGRATTFIAARVPRLRRPLLRLAVANLHRPGAQTSALVVSLGLALTLFVLLAAIQTSMTAEIETTVPREAPSLFVLDIPSDKLELFRDTVGEQSPAAEINLAPAMRASVVAYGGQRVGEMDDPPDAFLLRGERGATYSATVPEGSELVEGSWWPADYDGPPLVSLDAKQAAELDLEIGDTLIVNVLGREIEARIASLRDVNWGTMGLNFIMVFSPNALADAPHSVAATISMAGGSDGVTRAILATFPSTSVIAVKEVVEQVRTLLDQMANAIVAAASITIFAGVAVLVGSIAASRQARIHDSIILKMVGATRLQVLGSQALEYALLAIAVSLVALVLGAIGSWFVMVQIFDFGWRPDWSIVLGTLAAGSFLTLSIGLAGSIPLMSVRPAQALRRL